jgi:hypothetical protein
VPLSKPAREFFDRLYHERFCPIREAHDSACRELEWTSNENHIQKFNLYEYELKQFLKAALDARVQAFRETFERIEEYPDDSDLQDLAKDLALGAEYAINGFPVGFFKGPLCSLPLNLVEARLQTLKRELEQLPSGAIAPAQRLVAEGKLIASRTPKHRRPIP